MCFMGLVHTLRFFKENSLYMWMYSPADNAYWLIHTHAHTHVILVVGSMCGSLRITEDHSIFTMI